MHGAIAVGYAVVVDCIVVIDMVMMVTLLQMIELVGYSGWRYALKISHLHSKALHRKANQQQ